jgi:tetratricopeptide (TPR) repeat protein
MMKATRIALIAVLIAIVVMAAPASAAMYGQTDSDKAENVIELAERAGERVEELIDLVSLNTTAIEEAGLIDQFDDNVSRFETGLENVTLAYASLAAEDYEGAIANATEALNIFKEVLTSIQLIMEESGISKGDIVEAQGLLEAMERALERIERLIELLPEDAEEALALLDEATNYLDIEVAKLWLLDGRVTETAYNLTEANHLISDSHQYLKDEAKESNSWRVSNYLGQMERAQERVMERYQYAGGEGIDVDSVLKSLGYENMNEFANALQNWAENAQGNSDIKDIVNELKELGRTIREVDQALAEEIGQHRHGQETADGNSGYEQGSTTNSNGDNGNTQTGDGFSGQKNSGSSSGQSQSSGNEYGSSNTSGGQSQGGSTGSNQGSTGNGN